MLAAQQDVDAVIIGHSVRPHTRKTLIMDLRRVCPDCLICFVYGAPETKGEPLADVSLDVSSGPESLVRYLQDRLPREKVSWNPLRVRAHNASGMLPPKPCGSLPLGEQSEQVPTIAPI